jgi:hypothetical protein
MYITIKSLKKSLGKYIEMNDLYIGMPIFILFLLLFSFDKTRMLALIFLTIGIFMMIPISVSKKNRMYKISILLFKYLFGIREYVFMKGENNEERETIK